MWFVLLVPSAILEILLVWAIFQQIILGSTFGNNPTSDLILIIFAIIFGIGFGIGLPSLLYIAGLDTQVTEHGICVLFRPFHRRWIIFEYKNIEKVKALTYNPLKDYGGWGTRCGPKGKAYNVSGNKGVLLTLTDRKKVLIGSTNHEVLYSSIKERISCFKMKMVP